MKTTQARYSDNYDYLIDSNGNRVELSDPRIVFIFSLDSNQYTRKIARNVFKRFGKKCRFTEKTSPEVLHNARKLCSGRECIPCNAIAGMTLMDIEQERGKDEISIYINLDQEGPCQNGAWPLLWDTFIERLDLKNAIFCAEPKMNNYYLGLGYTFICGLMTSVILGDLLLEAKNSLLCLARDKEQALRVFETETDRLIEKLGEKKQTVKPRLTRTLKDDIDFIRQAITEFRIAIPFLKKWAKNISRILHSRPLSELPRVLIFGGLNVFFVHYPVTDYFLEQGIIPRIIDLSEGISLIESEEAIRYSLRRGKMNPKQQLSLLSIFLSWLMGRKANKIAALRALESRILVLFIDVYKKKYRKIMERSGLLFDRDISFPELMKMGHQYARLNVFCESTPTAGRYVCAVKDDVFDGMVNLASFNCQPAMNSQAIIRPLAAQNDIPYVTLDCEGPYISANQRRLLETVAVQVKRIRAAKA